MIFLGKFDDDREELLSAANYARNASYLACSSAFWEKLEPILALIIEESVNEFEEGKNTENIALQDTFGDSAYDTFHHDDFSEPRKKDRREVEIELHVDLVHDYFAP
ncbi:uncharacterized protein LOC110894831 [Helianthus annuus]|uniref:uncharacterized protein LOC110894831 n=1 Tax=Helianthus annuus TaxID=4232 RepID=UPI001652CD08|nr:uncharacterized protein LOC110894831 [Helianthus annuus]XP_035837037.1 uncharacterized protein LOC110894831 [Helianthus annuus]